MKVELTEIPGVVVIEPHVLEDQRGFFFESWNAKRFAEHSLDATFVQDNHSKSGRGTLRGLHYQIRQAQTKVVRVIAGRVFDVAVDLRRSSPSFGRWVGAELSAENRKMLWIPAGFAHGFYVLSEAAEFVYKCTDFYAPEWERTIRWNDPDLAIEWPLIDAQPPRVSDKDDSGMAFRSAEYFP